MSGWTRLFFAVLISFLPTVIRAQSASQQADSLVSLINAKSMELIEDHGTNYRKVTGPARFLHNNTYLVCDTALWNVNTQEIEAIGNVKILQENTQLNSDRLLYLIDQDLAQFRGNVVQLEDKDKNLLRTKFLDYNTKDSVAVFKGGGAMRDKEGQIIESLNGTYDSKSKTFVFTDNVNMFTDSIFVKTSRLEYYSDDNYAVFGRSTDAWKEDDMLSSDSGWYDRNRELFFFTDNVHCMTDTQEGWSDSLYFHRLEMNVEMLGNAQVTDTTRNSSALAGKMVYEDALSRVTLSRNPVIVAVTDTTGTAKDSVYVGADLMILNSVRKCDVDSLEFVHADKRLADLKTDAVAAYRVQAEEEARQAAETERMKNGDLTPRPNASDNAKKNKQADTEEPQPQLDSLSQHVDSLGLVALIDTVAAPPDTSKVAFIQALHNVKLFREDSQMSCDSLVFNELDSLVRLHREPMVWNEGNRQYAADSIYVSFGPKSMDKAYLMSDAFVTVEETEDCYDQIRSTEMLAFFDESGALRRFDAMGGADAIFYLKEDSTYATVNKSQARLLSAILVDGSIDSATYFGEPHNDAYPLAQMKSDDRLLKGFNWQPEKRPDSPHAITELVPRKTQRKVYAARPRAQFRQTEIYFPDYMSGVYSQIAENRERARRRAEVRDSLSKIQSADSTLALGPGSVDSAGDSLSVLHTSDSLSVTDSSAVALADSSAFAERPLSQKELEKARKAAARAAKLAARDKRWAALDSLDAAKAAAKAELKAEKARAKKLKTLEAQLRQQHKDDAVLEKYRLLYEKRRKKKSGTSETSEIPEMKSK